MKCARKTTVLFLLLVCVSKCSSMLDKELEDFSNFLASTSQLDQNLKKGTEGEFDEEEPVSDHAWEESGKFEGDLILNDRQRKLIVEDVAEGLSRNGLKDSTKRWPDNEVIYYIQKEHFSAEQVQAIQDGIDDLAQASCIKFRPYRKGDRDAVVIQGSRRGCFSQVGYQSGYQVLNLSGRHPVGRGCFRHGTVVHELLHTLGFYHMQSSPDRDDHVDVIWENILKPARHNFRKYNTFAVTDFGVGYDYDSVLHYSRRAFSRNGQDTIVPKKSGADIGQRAGLSDKDTQKLNKMYCDADSGSFDADEEDTTKKPVIKKKKKKPKNRPFQGHGIGYHQGKAVVIKLPTVEIHKLPDLPSYHVFDYFSKAPQALSPTLIEGFGIGKEITYSRESSSSDNINKPNVVLNAAIADAHTNELKTKPYTDQSNRFKSFIQSKENETENIRNDSIENGKEKITLNDDKTEVFDRLVKIIKTHVYPSQSPDLNLYKPNEDFHNYRKIASDRRKGNSKENFSLINRKHPNNSEPLNQKNEIFEIDITKNIEDNIKNKHDINYYLPTITSKQASYSSNPKNMYEDTHNISFDYSPNWYKQLFLENNSHDKDIINSKPLHGDINEEIRSTVLQEKITNEPENQSETSYANSKKNLREKGTRLPLDKSVYFSKLERENPKEYSGFNIFDENVNFQKDMEQRLASILKDYTKFDTYDITSPYYNYYSSKEADDQFSSPKYTQPKEHTFADIKINY